MGVARSNRVSLKKRLVKTTGLFCFKSLSRRPRFWLRSNKNKDICSDLPVSHLMADLVLEKLEGIKLYWGDTNLLNVSGILSAYIAALRKADSRGYSGFLEFIQGRYAFHISCYCPSNVLYLFMFVFPYVITFCVLIKSYHGLQTLKGVFYLGQ